ncbi:MAG: hypothetical protein K2N56_09120 [Oscillospiraceae bacterium]|nr:hypothetical protein [Oscillospiraceae bacterium]
MTRQNITERCRRISAGYNENSVCCFADNGGLLGFIDTSQGQNGTRGIAFSEDSVLINFDGEPIEIFYKKIKSVQIISSFEDFFADELSVIYNMYADASSDKEIRVSDFSLDKSELKRLLDGLRGEGTENKAEVSEKTDTPKKEESAPQNRELSPPNMRKVPPNSGKLPQNTGILPQYSGMPNRHGIAADSDKQSTVRSIPSEFNERAADHSDKRQISTIEDRPRENALNDLDREIPPAFRRQEEFVDIDFEDRAPVITETVLPQSSGMRTTVIERSTENNEAAQQYSQADHSRDQHYRNDLYDDNETAERIRIQNMSPEETLSFLTQSLNEINAPIPKPAAPVRSHETAQRERVPLYSSPEIRNNDNSPLFRQPEITRRDSAPLAGTRAQTDPSNQAAAPRQNTDHPVHKEELKHAPLTVEPIWGDIYIKASRNLRELCESGRLSMVQIETELDNKLLDSAKAFAEITSDESKVPKVLIPKITELKAAAKNFDTYFQSGEDIAVRAMFFMMYQMLSYADRIVETPETKERLNDFFRRFGSAGIMLSMLDMRV